MKEYQWIPQSVRNKKGRLSWFILLQTYLNTLFLKCEILSKYSYKMGTIQHKDIRVTRLNE